MRNLDELIHLKNKLSLYIHVYIHIYKHVHTYNMHTCSV